MKTITQYHAQKVLTGVWYGGTGLLLIVLLFWMMSGKMPIDEISSWILRNEGPYITLITTTFIVSYGTNRSDETNTVDVFFYRLSLWVSVFYLVVLLFILMSLPNEQLDAGEESIAAALKRSEKILPFFQSILGGVLGVFFIKSRKGG